MRATQWWLAVTEGCKCHSGDVLMKALQAQHERQLFRSPWHQLFLAGELPTGLEGVQRKVPWEPDGEGTELAVWTSHRRAYGVLVHLCVPSPGGREEEARREEALSWRGESELGCFRPTWRPPSLPFLLSWRCQEPPQDSLWPRGESKRQISLQAGSVPSPSCADPASFPQVHAGERCPGERGLGPLLLLLGTSPVSRIVLLHAGTVRSKLTFKAAVRTSTITRAHSKRVPHISGGDVWGQEQVTVCGGAFPGQEGFLCCPKPTCFRASECHWCQPHVSSSVSNCASEDG